MFAEKRSTKICATVGPSCSSPEMIEKLFQAGVNVFRLNFSHGSHEDHEKRLQIIRDLEAREGKPIGVMMDLQGPKLRVGRFSDGSVFLNEGQCFTLDLNDEPGDVNRVQLPHPELYLSLDKGVDLLLDDGKVKLRVENCTSTQIETKVIIPGYLSNHKGLNIPGIQLPISALTAKDKEDLKFGLGIGIDIVALSFVQCPADVQEAKDIIGDKARIVTKIEKPLALEHLEEIVQLADAVMVARGDLGVEMPPEDVPPVQKMIVRICRDMGKPVIVATQMLDSMVRRPTPTRAEASDVATAVYEGVDAVMLSAESASGEYPAEAVTMMKNIILKVEQDKHYRKDMLPGSPQCQPTDADAITMAASKVVETIEAKAIVNFTTHGSTTIRASRERPEVPILALTSSIKTARFMTMVWGVIPKIINDVVDFFHISEVTSQSIVATGLASAGARVVVTAGVPYQVSGGTPILVPGTTNLLRIIEVQNA